ncbi:flavodoxin domain-containing protein [Actinomycetaceae bacterium L2_0104]
MAKVVVIYNTVTGFSRTYGEWIAEDLGAELVPFAEIKSLKLDSYDLIVFGAGVRMSIMRGFSDFRKQLKAAGLEDSAKVIVWANGGTPQHPDRDWKVPAATFTKEELAKDRYPFFYFEAGVRYEGLNKPEYALLKVFSKRVQKYRDRGEWAEAVADRIAEGYDHSSREDIEPLVAKARDMLAGS